MSMWEDMHMKMHLRKERQEVEVDILTGLSIQFQCCHNTLEFCQSDRILDLEGPNKYCPTKLFHKAYC